ncbi:MAG: hypothetical protein J5687_05720 [Treponema sp.]|nr:hypothetical protein [Treponema sp.]
MKKIMTIIAAAAVALTLVGCAKFGDADTSGVKWSKEFKLDATGDLKDANGADAAYSRAFVALSASKKCSAIETKITLPIKNSKDEVVTAIASSVVGLAFDVHLTKDANNKEFYDFVLVGVRPATNEFYIEKYENISKDELKESMCTNDSAINGAVKATDSNKDKARWTSLDGKTSGAYSTTKIDTNALNPTKLAEEGYTWTVSVTQATAGTYKVSINGKELGEYKRDLSEAETKDKKAYGQVFMYGNAAKGEKFSATFKSDKEKTTGLFADDEDF